MKGFFYVSLLLSILKEVTRSALMQKTDSGEDIATLFDMVQKVFQQMLECMARSFRKQPEEGLRVLVPPQGWSELDHLMARVPRARPAHMLPCWPGCPVGIEEVASGCHPELVLPAFFRGWRTQAVVSALGAGGPGSGWGQGLPLTGSLGAAFLGSGQQARSERPLECSAESVKI